MPFARPTLQQIVDRIEQNFNTRIENSQSFLRRSVLKVMARVYAGAIHLLYGYMEFMKDQLFVSKADTTALNDHGTEYGIPRIAGDYATGTGTATGTDGSTIPAGSKLTSPSGNNYYVDSAATISGGTASIDFTAEAIGTDYNDEAGISLTFVSPIAGIDTSVTVGVAGIIDGLDNEDDEAYRARILVRKRQPPHGGNQNDYMVWCREVAGVTRAWAFGEYYGPGTVGIAFTRDDDTSIIPSPAEITEVQDYIISHTDPITGKDVGIPVTAEPGLFMIQLELQTLDFTIQLSPNTAVVQASVEQLLEDLIYTEGGPGETIYLSQIDSVISQATGEDFHILVSPATDIGSNQNQVPALGTITFEAING